MRVTEEGIAISSKVIQLAKVELSILSIDFGMNTSDREEQFSKEPSSIIDIPSESRTLSNFSHPAKTLLPSVFTESGITISDKEMHSAKQ